ncbi:MAG: zinc-binding dehydrogenase [Oscillospiraceae bacterium]|nr:zinc-binding dehydrogenase [Oscillospiraceae bacterium]
MMKTKAVRLYGKQDLRLEEFELPEIGEGEILAKIVSDSICMSTHKAAILGADHKRVPDNVAENPTIVGHEFCGELIEVGAKWRDKFSRGQKFTVQPALNYKGSLDAPGYSFKYIGGSATYVVIPEEVMLQDCLLIYSGEAFFYGSLSEPMSCIVGAFHASFHTTAGKWIHDMGIKPGGSTAILAGAGPMGIGAIAYAAGCDKKPGLVVVTDVDDVRLKRASELLPPEKALESGVRLIYKNTSDVSEMMELTGGKGYDDVFVFAPVAPLLELGDRILGRDGCLNFFAGPVDSKLSAKINFYNVHYSSTHTIGTSGGNTDDMREALSMMERGLINPASMVTHIGGLDSVIDTTLNLPNIPGGKKLIYTHISMPLTALNSLQELGKTDPALARLAEIVESNNGLWCTEAEKFLLEGGQ